MCIIKKLTFPNIYTYLYAKGAGLDLTRAPNTTSMVLSLVRAGSPLTPAFKKLLTHFKSTPPIIIPFVPLATPDPITQNNPRL